MNYTISLICIIGFLLVWAGFGVYYYKRQNSADKIGGHISIPKAMWLNYALYIYLVFPLGFFMLYFPAEPWKTLLILVLGIFAFRIVVQSSMMYIVKNWRTKHGVAFNVTTAVIVIFYLGYIVISNGNIFGFNPKSTPAWFYFLFGCVMASTLLVDSYYAVEFNKLVGEKTMGDKAIWFASNDPKFDRINSITRRNNILFILAIILILSLYINNYDQF